MVKKDHTHQPTCTKKTTPTNLWEKMPPIYLHLKRPQPPTCFKKTTPIFPPVVKYHTHWPVEKDLTHPIICRTSFMGNLYTPTRLCATWPRPPIVNKRIRSASEPQILGKKSVCVWRVDVWTLVCVCVCVVVDHGLSGVVCLTRCWKQQRCYHKFSRCGRF